VLTLADPGFDLWRRFTRGKSVDSEHPVVARWKRVRQLRARQDDRADSFELSLPERQHRTMGMFVQGGDLLRAGVEEFRRRGCTLVLADTDGVIIGSHGLDALSGGVMREDFEEGVQWNEVTRGTNAIGTSLAEDLPVAVIGRAHSDAGGHGLVCYAAPIHTAEGKLVAVLDVSGPVTAADPLIGVAVQGLASAFEGALRARAFDQLAGQLEELHQKQTATRAARDELEAKLRHNETFVATVGHDLRNPLAAVLSGADLLAKSDDGAYRRVAERIRSSGGRMFRMIEELSDLAQARLGGGIRLANQESIDLGRLGERVVTELRAANPHRTIQFFCVGDLRGRWDPARLEQMLSNLIANGVRHGEQQESVRITIDGNGPDSVTLAVTNAGEIDSAILPHIFEPFYSGESSRGRSEGLGLGLFIVEQIVRAHQGHTEVATRDGWTTFFVTLPRRPAPAD
jgi:signal transduction histidine kinase